MIYTLGHSTLTKDEFSFAAKSRKVSTILDIRSHPTSKWEWFWKEKMEEWLPKAGLAYEWWPQLGGWTKRHLEFKGKFGPRGVDLDVYAKGKFPKQRIGKDFEAPDEPQLGLPGVKPAWTNVGLYDYQFFLSIPEAVRGLKDLVERGLREDVAIVCSEAQWWRCHRSMVSDALASAGVASLHVMPTFRQKDLQKYVAGTKVINHFAVLGNRLERYEPDVVEAWDALKTRRGPSR